ncbi:MAG: SurA N-terminal domain-containing protein [Oligoflexia bacterium]|nr:SurA N-terminal domain-containing protein [Oligoflexia bacterium]
MLRLMHKYRRSLFGIILVGLCALAMSGFGVDMLRRQHESYAIKIDDHIISFDDFHRERRALEQRYRMIFGKNFLELSQQLNLNLGQQTVDKLINDYLIERESSRLGLSVGAQEVAGIIQTQLFHGNFDPKAYSGFLNQMGLTSKQFEAQLASDAQRQAFIGMLRFASIASETEARAAYRRDETTIEVNYAEIDPAKYASQVADPASEVLSAYYNENSSSYELPPRISYDYVTLDPQKFLDLVVIAPEDVEIYYADHQSEFTVPEQVKARHIQLNYSKNASAEQMASLKEKAQQVHEKAVAGEPFETLVLQFSDDLTTKSTGGDLGWLGRGKMAPAFDEEAFKTKQGGVAALVETDYGFHIIKIDDYRASSIRPLPDVRTQIEKALRAQEAPAYVSDKAHTLFEEWSKGGMALPEFAATNNLVAVSTNGLLQKDKDPDDGLRGLTAKVINFPDDKRQIVDVGDKAVLVAIKQYRDQEIPPLEQVKTQVIESFKKREAKKLAEKTAHELAKAVATKKELKFAEIVKASKVEAKNIADLKRGSAASHPPFGDGQIQKAVFGTQAARRFEDSFSAGGKFYVAEVAGVKLPTLDLADAKLQEVRKRESEELAQNLVTSVSNALKAAAAIDVAPGLVSVEE